MRVFSTIAFCAILILTGYLMWAARDILFGINFH